MAEKVIGSKENIFKTARRLGEGESESDSILARILPVHREVLEKGVKFSEIGRIHEPVIVDFGGGTGMLGEVIKEKHPEKKVQIIDIDYILQVLKKSKDSKVLGDMSNLPLRDNFADAVFIDNLALDIDNIKRAVERYPVTKEERIYGADERIGLLQTLKSMSKSQSTIIKLEAVRVLKVGGKFVSTGAFTEVEVEDAKRGYDPSRTGALELRSMDSRKFTKKHEATVLVYEKTKDVEVGEMMAEAKEHLKFLIDSLEIYEMEGGLLNRMRKEGKI